MMDIACLPASRDNGTPSSTVHNSFLKDVVASLSSRNSITFEDYLRIYMKMKTQSELVIQMGLDAWNIQISRFNQLLDILSDDQMQLQIAPGKNRGVYLLGHLAAIHDKMLPLL